MNFIFHLLFLSITKKIILLTPIWNLETTAEDLLLNTNKTSIKLSDGGWKSVENNNNIILRKQIVRENNKINIKNYYKIDNFDEKETKWEDIESFYQIGAYYICPKGSFYLTEYKNGNLYIKKPFDISGEWEFFCYRQINFYNMFTFYLNSNMTKIYYYDWNNFKEGVDIKRRLFDFKWTTNPTSNNGFPMLAITFKNDKIYLSKLIFYFNNNIVSYQDVEHIELNDNLLYSEGYFLYVKSKFCWMTYNKTTLISGYSENEIKNGVNSNIKDYILKKNTKSPFQFLDDITIESLKLIRETKYILYNIITNSNNKKYIGVIDIEFNKVIYNVENIFKDIKPYSMKGLFLETDSTVYRVCFLGKDKNNECYSECPSGQILVLDNINSNYCADKNSNDYYILKPDNIEIANCDENLYIIQNQNECGLCKDLNIDKPYKIIDEKECLDKKPENTYYIYEQLKILKSCHESCKTCNSEKENDCTTCYIGYKLIDGKCIKMNCYSSCKECDEESNDENNQHCLSCQNNKLFQEDNNNCIDKCLNGYYEEKNYCKKCHESCKTCNSEKENDCTTCYIGYKLIDGKCIKMNCYSSCKECDEESNDENNQHCLSCQNNKFFQEDNNNCIDKCLNGYYEENSSCKKCHKSCKTCNSEKENDCTTCYIGYKLIDGKCIKMNCYPSCKECDEESNDENNQHCLSCQNNKLFQEDNNNCIDKCLNGYYEENSSCKKCHKTCLTCEKKGTDENPNCQSCKDNKYLIDNNLNCIDDCEINYYKNLTEKKCYKCHNNCKTCSRSSFENNYYCLSCDQNSKYKYLLNTTNISNCVEECPNSTILNITINQCLEKINKTNINNDKIPIYILILLSALIIIIIFICIICLCFNKKRNLKSDSQIMNNINVELKKDSIMIEK